MIPWSALRIEPGQLLNEQLRIVLRNQDGSVIPGIAFMALLAWRMAQSVQWEKVLAWWLAMSFFSLVGWLHARYHLNRGWSTEKAPAIVRQLYLVHGIDGCLWGALTWLSFGVGDGQLEIIATASLTGIVAHGVAQNAAIPRVFLSFLFSIIVVGDLHMMVDADTTVRILGLGGLLLVPTFTAQALNTAYVVRTTIELTIEKDALIKEAESARQDAVRANTAKSVFLAAASHDLRQPVHAQALFLEALSTTPLETSQKELLSNARLAASASSDLLDALLDFSRLEAGVVVPAPRPFSIQDLFYSVENEAAPMADDKALVFRCRETSLATYSDPALVELIVRNLTSNAIKYTRSGGVLLAARRRASTVILEVWDTGVGIAPHNQEAIFQEFHQLNNPERDRRKGLGLGLAIAKRLSDRLGHPLSLRSRPKRGSVFRLEVPLYLGEVAQRSVDIDSEFALTGKRALVIDDDELALHGLGSLLHSWGMLCDLTTSTDQALQASAVHIPDIIVSDFRLAEASDGAAAIVQLRAALNKDIPALLVTGDTSPERLRDATATGIPLLHKPAAPEDLRRFISQALR